MQIPSYDSHEWLELMKVTEYRNGKIFKTAKTGKHIRVSEPAPDGYIAVAISTKETKRASIEINPYHEQ